MSDVADTLQQLNRLPEAQALQEKVLAIREDALGPYHIDVASSLYRLGILQQAQGKTDKAEKLYRDALSIREKRNDTGVETMGIMARLAALYVQQEKSSEAFALYQKLLPLQEKYLGAEHIDLVPTLNQIGTQLEIQGKFARAEPLLLRALAIQEKQQSKPEKSARARINLGFLYRGQKQYDQAEIQFRKALATLEKVHGPDHIEVAAALTNLAMQIGRAHV